MYLGSPATGITTILGGSVGENRVLTCMSSYISTCRASTNLAIIIAHYSKLIPSYFANGNSDPLATGLEKLSQGVKIRKRAQKTLLWRALAVSLKSSCSQTRREKSVNAKQVFYSTDLYFTFLMSVVKGKRRKIENRTLGIKSHNAYSIPRTIFSSVLTGTKDGSTVGGPWVVMIPYPTHCLIEL